MSSSAPLDGSAPAAAAAAAAASPSPAALVEPGSCSKLGRFNYHLYQATDRFLGHRLSSTPGRYQLWARWLGFHSLDAANTHKTLQRALSDAVLISNQHGSAELGALEAAGVTHIVVAGTGRNVGPFGLWPRFPDRFQYLHVELRDNESDEQAAAMQRAIQSAVPFIEQAVQGGGRVLIHCSAGISRSASLVIAHALYSGLFDSFDDAYAALKASRTIVLPNPSFERILRAYASEQKARRADIAALSSAVAAAAASPPSVAGPAASASPSLDSSDSIDSGWSSGSLGSSSELRAEEQ